MRPVFIVPFILSVWVRLRVCMCVCVSVYLSVCIGISGFFLGSEGRCTSKDQLVLSGGYTSHTHILSPLCHRTHTNTNTQTHTEHAQDAIIPQSSTTDFTSNALSPARRQNQLFLRLCVSIYVALIHTVANDC